jgi:hypothetical protein
VLARSLARMDSSVNNINKILPPFTRVMMYFSFQYFIRNTLMSRPACALKKYNLEIK